MDTYCITQILVSSLPSSQGPQAPGIITKLRVAAKCYGCCQFNSIIKDLVSTAPASPGQPRLELQTKVKRRFTKVRIVSYCRPSLMIIVSASQFYIYLPWGQRLFSIVSYRYVKALVRAFYHTFSVITNLRVDLRLKLCTYSRHISMLVTPIQVVVYL